MSKRKCIFSDDLQTKYPHFKKIDGDRHSAVCSTCDTKVSIANKGKFDLDQHMISEKHQKRIRGASSSSRVSDFFVPVKSTLQDQISAAEGTLSFHTVKHHFSFKSVDCSHKLQMKLFPDSSIASKISCARTKTEAIVVNVIAPLSIEIMLDDIRNTPFLSISTDASNHGNQKLFPIVLQYFVPASGVQVKLIDLCTLPDETAESISGLLVSVLDKFHLSSKLVAFSGDNCNTNFGGKNRAGKKNVFAKLKAAVNVNLMGIGCPAHIVHNSVQHGMDALPLDIGSIVQKVFNHFSIYTVRNERLKQFCEFVDVEYRAMLNYCKTRWLSLLPCLTRMIEMYAALKSFFTSAENAPPLALKMFFEEEINEAYLWFSHSLMYVFDAKIKLIERENSSVVEMLMHMQRLILVLKARSKEQMLPLEVKTIFNRLKKEGHEDKVLAMQKTFLHVYEQCTVYLEEWSATMTEFECFAWMQLSAPTTWDSVSQSLEYIRGKNIQINESELFNQFCFLQSFVEQKIHDEIFLAMMMYERWSCFFQTSNLSGQTSELLKLAQFVLCIPAHNGNVERIFSLITAQWTDERNRLTIASIKGIMLTNFNFKGTQCNDFYKMVLKKPKSLKQIQSNDKYLNN